MKNSDKRVIFKKGEQEYFLVRAIKEIGCSWGQLADILGVNGRTFNDWKREKYSLSFGALKKICGIASMEMPDNVEIRKPYWSTKKAAQIAGRLVYEKYGIIGGDPENRKQKWREWWEKTGKFKPMPKNFTRKAISFPGKSKHLAEFVGIVMGDGGISKRQVTIALNRYDDKDYSIFVINLIKKLFKVVPGVHKRKNEKVCTIFISRTSLIPFCQSIGLKVGNKLKQNLDIPDWIKKNPSYRIACMRGLMDTDGCIYNECHKIKKKKYCYPRLAFVSASPNLICSVFDILENLGFSPRIRNNRNVNLETREDVVKYFKLIGTSNPKHKKRFKIFYGGIG